MDINVDSQAFDPKDFAVIDELISNALNGSLDSSMSASSPSEFSTSDPTSDDVANGNAPSSAKRRTGRRPIPSRGHRKSRMGCYNCKKRKVKCQESRPECENCRKAGATCHYPPAKAAFPTANGRSQTTQCSSKETDMILTSPAMSPQATPYVFSMEDMQYFHRFLTGAYPRLPVGGGTIWQLDVPRLAHQYDYVIHAMLALGASRIAATTNVSKEFETAALAHRVHSVESLNKAIKTESRSRDEADARFAALMILTHQSSCLADGMTDFFTMLRGCVLSGMTMNGDESSCFATFMRRRHFETMESRFSERQLKDLHTKPLDSAAASLERLAPFCTHPVEKQYHAVLTNLIQEAFVSPKLAYMQLMYLFNFVGLISTADFNHLLNPDNAICRILLSHFCAFHWITQPLTELENPGQDMTHIYAMIQTWCCLIHAGLDRRVRYLNEWPMNLVNHSSPWRDIEFDFDLSKAQRLADDVNSAVYRDYGMHHDSQKSHNMIEDMLDNHSWVSLRAESIAQTPRQLDS